MQDRQNQLLKKIHELRHAKLEKTKYLLADPHIYNRKQSIDSDYMRSSVAMLKLHMGKDHGGKGKSAHSKGK